MAVASLGDITWKEFRPRGIPDSIERILSIDICHFPPRTSRAKDTGSAWIVYVLCGVNVETRTVCSRISLRRKAAQTHFRSSLSKLTILETAFIVDLLPRRASFACVVLLDPRSIVG